MEPATRGPTILVANVFLAHFAIQVGVIFLVRMTSVVVIAVVHKLVYQSMLVAVIITQTSFLVCPSNDVVGFFFAKLNVSLKAVSLES